jgi:hypothetical protein
MEMRNYMQQVGMPARWPGRDGAGKGTALKAVHGVVACGWEIDWCGTVFPYKLSPTPPAAASKPLQLIGTQHYGGAYPGNTFSSRDTPIQADQAADFHVFALEWEQKQVAGRLMGRLLLGWHTVLCSACLPACLPARLPACLPARLPAVLQNGAAGTAARRAARPLSQIGGSVFHLAAAAPCADALVPGWSPVLFNEQRQRQPHAGLVQHRRWRRPRCSL